MGIGFVYSKISDHFRNFGTLLGGAPLGSEKAFELNYSLQVRRYWLVQPTFQYYANLGGNPSFSNAPVFGFRTKNKFYSRRPPKNPNTKTPKNSFPTLYPY